MNSVSVSDFSQGGKMTDSLAVRVTVPKDTFSNEDGHLQWKQQKRLPNCCLCLPLGNSQKRVLTIDDCFLTLLHPLLKKR